LKPLENAAPDSAALSSRLSPADMAGAVAALARAAEALAALAGALGASGLAAGSLSPARRPGVDSPALVEAVNEFIVAKARAGRSDRYLRALRVTLSALCKTRARRPLASISTGELEKALDAPQWSPRTRLGYLRDWKTFFGWCVRRGLVQTSPAAAVEAPPLRDDAPPAVLTPAEASALLRGVYGLDKGLGRHLALRLFAGVRAAEAHRLRECDLHGGFVEVPAAKSKTRSRRLVTIQPALASFLALGGELRPVSPNKVRAAIRASGVNVPHNALRHSFVSYHLEAFGSPGRTALESGHAEAVLFRHYRAVVTPEAAKAFWALRP
jgi:integrase